MKNIPSNTRKASLPFLLLSLAIITLNAACGSSTPSDNDNNKDTILAGSDICNDQEGIQLSFRQTPPWGRLGYEHMMYENGSQYFLIDGTCKFWFFPGGLLGQNGIWNSVYTGQLTTELADEMATNLRLGRLESLAGFYAEKGNFDMPLHEMRF